MSTSMLYVGAWNQNEIAGGRDGLWVWRFDERTGVPELVEEVEYEYDAGTTRGNRLRVGAGLVHAGRRRYYATDERSTCLDGVSGGGRIVSFDIMEDGRLRFTGQQWSMGPQPSYICFDEREEFLLCSLLGYESSALRTVERDGVWEIENVVCETGTVLFGLRPDGTVGDAIDVLEHGMEPAPLGDLTPLPAPNPHCVQRAPGRNLFVTCDKGRSTLNWFRIDYERTRLQLLAEVEEVIDRETGWGCRYTVWHPHLDIVYVNNEKEPLFTAWRYTEHGEMELLQRISPFDPATDEAIVEARRTRPGMKFEQQDVRISADGRFIYNCSRCANEFDSVLEAVTVFAVLDDGTLERRQTLLLGDGALWPRGAAISPSGRWLLIACVYSSDIRVLEIGSDGLLTEAGVYPSPSAANLAFLA